MRAAGELSGAHRRTLAAEAFSGIAAASTSAFSSTLAFSLARVSRPDCFAARGGGSRASSAGRGRETACAWLAPLYVDYTVGSLALGLAAPNEEEVVFGGLLQGVADGSGNTEDRIRDGVHVMFEDYPEPPAE